MEKKQSLSACRLYYISLDALWPSFIFEYRHDGASLIRAFDHSGADFFSFSPLIFHMPIYMRISPVVISECHDDYALLQLR